MKLRPMTALLLPLLLAACGDGGTAIDEAKKIPNRFGNATNALDDFSPGSTGDSGNTAGLKANEVRLTMEVPARYAPQADETRRNLRMVVPDQVDIYRHNERGQNLGRVNYSLSTGEDGHLVVAFHDGLPTGPDVVIEARYAGTGGTLVMKALAADADRDIKINPFSHYLVQEGLGSYSSGEFQAVMDCVDDRGGALCLNKYAWSGLADQVHDFEIDIAANASLEQVITALSNRADFAGYVDKMARSARLGAGASGSIRASSADYNSVFLALELGQTFRDSRYPGAALWGARTAQELDLGGAFLYPALTLTSFEAFNINVTSLVTDIPYRRQALIHGFDPGGDVFSLAAAWADNTHASAPGAATLTPPSPEGDTPARLLAGRSLYQSITEEAGQENGWTRNPYFMDAYTPAPGGPNQSPDRVLDSYFTAGKAIALARDGNGERRVRRETLEEYYLSVFELHLKRSEGFEVSTVQSGDYNLVYLATQLGGSDPLIVESGHGSWQAGTGTLTTDNFVIRRDADGIASAGATAGVGDTWQVRNRPASLSSGPASIGRLTLCRACAGEPPLGLGAATPGGDLVAFNLHHPELGQGLVVAAEKTPVSAPVNGTYRVQGVMVGLDAGESSLLQLADTTLIFGNDGADLAGAAYRVTHQVADNEVTAPQEDLLNLGFNVTMPGDGRIVFDGGELVMEGFFTGSGDQLFLVLSDSTGPELRTGLLLATLIPG